MSTTEEEDAGRGLAGPGAGRAARRRWYFSHQAYERAQKRHSRAARDHRDTARYITPEERERDVRKRNQAKVATYRAELREWEERRLAREDAKEQWLNLRSDILHNGGVKASNVGEDYRGIPGSLRRSNGMALDNLQEYYGFKYQSDFEQYVESAHTRYQEASKQAPKRPKKPVLEKEPRRLRQPQTPELKSMKAEIKETRAMLRDGEKELGPNHPALAELRQSLKEQQREYTEVRNRGRE